MSKIIELMFSEKVTVSDIVLWLRCDDKTKSPDCLRELDSVKNIFVSYFLNYLREQSEDIVQASHVETVSKLTPNKTPVRSKNHDNVKIVSNPRRVRLFAESPIKEKSCILNISLDEKTEEQTSNAKHNRKQQNYRKDKSNRHLYDSSKKSQSLPLESTPRHKQKLSFGQYISLKDTDVNNESLKTANRNFEKINNGDYEDNNIFDENAFPPIATISSNQKKKISFKRIKPTLVKTDFNQNIQPMKSSSMFSNHIENKINFTEVNSRNPFIANVPETSRENFSEERELLRQEKVKWNQSRVNADHVADEPTTPRKFNKLTKLVGNDMKIANTSLEKVTYTAELDIMSSLYSSFLSYNLVPNLTVEIYFILQLLTLRYQPKIRLGNDDDFDIDEKFYLKSVHNCVYFATRVIEQQIKLFECIDINLIKLLMEMDRIKQFSSSLTSKLNEINLSGRQNNSLSKASLKSNISGVAYQVDTDNQNNFLTDVSFRIFRKQRDLFYEIIRLWEDNHLTCGWSLHEICGSKIKSAVDMRMDPVSYSHFARLFVAQLILMCKGFGSSGSSTNNQNQDLSSFMNADPEKIKKLQERFVKPKHVGGLCPPPSFIGYQEFFKDFILIAQSPYFIQHLVNHLTYKIYELNETQFETVEDHQNDTLFEEVQDQFLDCMQTLRLLGKFLGFVIFLPYRTSQKITEYVITNEIVIRSKVAPPIDIFKLIYESISKHRKILVIPWVVEFISMMDSFAPSIEYYHKVLCLIVYVYRILLVDQSSSLSNLMMLLLLGWLFQTPNFPESLLYQESSTLMQIYSYASNQSESHLSTFALDESNFVDQTMLYTCCPYLCELRLILNEFSSNTINRCEKEVRKITPITNSTLSLSFQNDQSLQDRLEENFFHNQPASLRKTVEFIADRIASNAIRHIREKSIPKIHQNCVEGLKYLIDDHEISESEKFNEAKNKFSKEIKAKSIAANEKAYNEISEFLLNYIELQSKSILPLMLPIDTSNEVVETCTRISGRMSNGKINNWCSKYVSVDYFVKELMTDCDKLWKQKLLNKSTLVKESFTLQCTGCHDVNFISPSGLLMKLKDIVKFVHDYKKQPSITIEEISDALQELKDLQFHRDDVTIVVIKTCCLLVSNLVVAIVAYHPDWWTESMEILFVNLFSETFKSSSSFNHSISSMFSFKTFLMFSSSCDIEKTFQRFYDIVQLIIKNKFLSSENLSQKIEDLRNFNHSKHVEDFIKSLLKSVERK